jgi:dihydroorotase
MIMKLTLKQPDDWHIHLRDGLYLERTVADAARQFKRVIVMPNLVPPIVNTAMAKAYRQRILACCPKSSAFQPLMTLYLTDNTTVEIIREAKTAGFIHACKLYPAGATTNSDAGVTDIKKIYPIFAAMEEVGLPLLLHGEVTRSDIDVFDREKVFIDEVLTPVCESFPNLKIVLEHISTKDAVQFVTEASVNIAATITAHHLLLNRNDMLVGGIKPHYYCLPILKRGIHQEALIKAAANGNPKFFLGSDSAPHEIEKKESACGCAGIYTAHAAIELYAEAFEQAGALDKLEAFASFHGADFYGLPRNKTEITLVKEDWVVPEFLHFGGSKLKPLFSGKIMHWHFNKKTAL